MLWGEVEGPKENVLGLTAQEREALSATSRQLAVEGPKFHQPTQGGPRVKAEEVQQGDPLVINTIQLLAHKRALDRLLDMVETYKTAISSGELERMPPLAPPPHMPEVVSFNRSDPDDYYARTSKAATHVREVGEIKARSGLRRAVVQLTAHAGFVTAQGSAVALLTDSVEAYLVNFCNKLRSALDHQLELAPSDKVGWTDALEKVAVEMGLSSSSVGEKYKLGILSVGDYYEEKVVGGQSRAVAQCKEREARYAAELPGEAGSWENQDEIPEMHFPSSDEGAGLEGDHATPTLDVGMQMLQSLEASGDLDTPLSVAESEALSGYSATPSPQVLTPGRAHTPHSPVEGRAKKRRRSGGKFL